MTIMKTNGRLISATVTACLAVTFLFPTFPSVVNVSAQTVSPTPPCSGDSYGTPETRAALDAAMFSGSLDEIRQAVRAAKEARGNRVGCGESAVTYAAPNFREPTLEEISAKWETVGAPAINSFNGLGCPLPGRAHAGNAVAGYYARLAGGTAELSKLAEINHAYEATQYSAKYAPLFPNATYPGVFGFLAPPDPCAQVDPVFLVAITQVCANNPNLCVLYTAGPYAGRRWLVGDIVPSAGIYDGGMAYDHGWAGVMMIEAAIQQMNPILKEKFRQSAELAGDWAISEPAVRNFNYTAKLIWLLAQLYNWQGQEKWRAGMLEKINRSLIHGALTDFDGDGLADGMNNQPFSGLTTLAQRPGRMWDGHNAKGVYQAMNTWAMVEAYAALRDRGDAAEAARLRPYTIAMLDNLAWEVNNQGTGAGKSQPPFALMLGIYKIADYENDPHPEWERAANALWHGGMVAVSNVPPNIGTFDIYTIAMFLLRRGGPDYVPLENRAGQPDLSVTNLTAAQSQPRQTILTATIRNQGTAAARNFIVRFFDGDNQLGDDEIVIRLGKNETVTVSFTWDTRRIRGERIIKAVVDPINAVVETDETNNEMRRTITIRRNI